MYETSNMIIHTLSYCHTCYGMFQISYSLSVSCAASTVIVVACRGAGSEYQVSFTDMQVISLAVTAHVQSLT